MPETGNSGFVEADGLQLALIDKHPMDVISDLVIAKSGRDIGRQIETLDVLARAQARKEAEVARKVAKDLSGCKLSNVPQIIRKFRILTCSLTVIHY